MSGVKTGSSGDSCFIEDLKQEAIKWVKKLKTLKDFEGKPFEGVGCDCGCCSTMAIDGDKLREEAIKWVKKLKTQIKPKNMEFREWRSSNYGAEEWIKYFFNLTEEDLK